MSPEGPPALPVAAARLLAVDPAGLGGAVLRGPPSSARDNWLALLRAHLPPGAPWRRLPAHVAPAQLEGALDLAATLAAGRPVRECGLLARASGGVLVVPGAERLDPTTAFLLAAALDGTPAAAPNETVAAVLFDEGEGDERVPAALNDRLAFHLELDAALPDGEDAADLAPARAQVSGVAVPEDAVAALCAAGSAFGVPSLRVAVLALRAAKASAALAGRAVVTDADVALAAALVIAPRATALPDDAAAPPPPPPQNEGAPAEPESDAGLAEAGGGVLADRTVAATRAALPPGLLAALAAAATDAARAAPGAAERRLPVRRLAPRYGRPVGVRRGLPGGGARLALIETLRAAAPWQRLRGRQPGDGVATPGRMRIGRDDLRVLALRARREAVTVFAVDASGSSALHRLAEAKGAVELMLADSYARRDQVALIAFRNTGAMIVLPPTRSLARAKRALAGQVGGGGTPLAAALEAAVQLAAVVRRKGQMPLVVLMTDGRANIDRAGRPGRAGADADARAAARRFRLDGAPGLLVDIAPRPADAARRLAADMGARYLALPHADARSLSRAILASRPNE